MIGNNYTRGCIGINGENRHNNANKFANLVDKTIERGGSAKIITVD